MTIKLLVFDAVKTLGDTTGAKMHEYVSRISPQDPEVVREACRTFTHRTPMPNPAAMESFCEAVAVAKEDLPEHWFTGAIPDLPEGHPHRSGFEAYGYAASAVADMIDIAGDVPAVVLSNLPSTTGPQQMAELAQQFPMIRKIYTSYDLGRRKPDSRLWLEIADEWDVEPHEVMHFGDLWPCDVLGATRAGAHAVFIADTGPVLSLPGDRSRLNPRAEVFVANTLRDARICVQAMVRGDRAE